MKGILFSDSGDLFRCSFDGADRYGKPCITVITQGEVVQSLDDLKIEEGAPHLKFRLLCLDGEPVSSLNVARLLGSVMVHPVLNTDEDMCRCITQMRRMKVGWEKGPLRLVISIEHFINENNEPEYSFHVIDMDTEDRLVDDVESDNLDDLFSYIHTFIHILVVEAEMCVDSLGLFANGAVLKEMDPDDFEIFDYINGQKQN